MITKREKIHLIGVMMNVISKVENLALKMFRESMTSNPLEISVSSPPPPPQLMFTCIHHSWHLFWYRIPLSAYLKRGTYQHYNKSLVHLSDKRRISLFFIVLLYLFIYFLSLEFLLPLNKSYKCHVYMSSGHEVWWHITFCVFFFYIGPMMLIKCAECVVK